VQEERQKSDPISEYWDELGPIERDEFLWRARYLVERGYVFVESYETLARVIAWRYKGKTLPKPGTGVSYD